MFPLVIGTGGQQTPAMIWPICLRCFWGNTLKRNNRDLVKAQRQAGTHWCSAQSAGHPWATIRQEAKTLALCNMMTNADILAEFSLGALSSFVILTWQRHELCISQMLMERMTVSLWNTRPVSQAPCLLNQSRLPDKPFYFLPFLILSSNTPML